MTLVSLGDVSDVFGSAHYEDDGGEYLGSHPLNSVRISSNAVLLFQVAGSDWSRWESTMLKDLPEAMVYVITWRSSPILR